MSLASLAQTSQERKGVKGLHIACRYNVPAQYCINAARLSKVFLTSTKVCACLRLRLGFTRQGMEADTRQGHVIVDFGTYHGR